MEKRGISADFLLPDYDKLSSGESLPDMEQAVARITEAVRKGEKVLIYGDYDADGVTASVVMHDTLKLVGIKEVEIMLPNRFADGFGMSEKVVERAVCDKVGLVITVDCGSGNREIVAKLTEAGIDTIITDHHECPEELPEAVAVVNPKRAKKSEWRDLAGVGVAFMLAHRLMEKGLIPQGQEKWLLDMVAIGTICDNMKLRGVNRCLVYWGMKVIEKTRRVGLRELIKRAGAKKINSYAVGFILGPRLNAGGRMKSAEVALELMMTESKVESAKLAEELEQLNIKRRSEQSRALAEIKQSESVPMPVMVVAGNWHEGVLGIIAGNLTEDMKRPSFVLTEVDGVYKGSGRSFGEFDLAQALQACKDEIIGGGGHAGACGVKIEKAKLDDFRKAVNDYYKSLGLVDQERFLEKEADIEIDDLSEVDMELMAELDKLEPFGEGNLEPVWLIRDALVLNAQKLGQDEQHLKLTIADGKKQLVLIAFHAPREWLKVREGMRRDFTVRLMVNEWNGLTSVEGVIEKIGVEKSGEF